MHFEVRADLETLSVTIVDIAFLIDAHVIIAVRDWLGGLKSSPVVEREDHFRVAHWVLVELRQLPDASRKGRISVAE